MNNLFRIFLLALLVSGFVVAPDIEAAPRSDNQKDQKAPKLYRYRNAKGSIVTSYVLPPDMVSKGYDVVTLEGYVVETVRPTLTDEERKAVFDAEEQAKFDKQLLLKYGSLAELLRTQKRKTEEVEAKMSILKGNLTAIRNQKEAAQKKAATYERQGKPVPPNDLAALENIYKSEDAAEEAIQILEKEFQAEKQRLEYEQVRFKKLKGIR